MKFDEVVKLKALQLKAVHSGQSTMEMLGEQQLALPEVAKDLRLRQVCAMVAPALFDKLEATCELLSMSKRAFVEAAIVDAIDKAESIVAEVDPFSAEVR